MQLRLTRKTCKSSIYGIETKNELKYLGVMIDDKMNFNVEAQRRKKK